MDIIFKTVLLKGESGYIADVEKTASEGLVDTYTITYNDGNTSNFQVTNGSGISSVAKTSTNGLVDTYTITYENGETSTFDITNGANGSNANLAPEESSDIASRAYTVGERLVFESILYKVTQAISRGDTLVENTNIARTTVAEDIEEVNKFTEGVVSGDDTLTPKSADSLKVPSSIFSKTVYAGLPDGVTPAKNNYNIALDGSGTHGKGAKMTVKTSENGKHVVAGGVTDFYGRSIFGVDLTHDDNDTSTYIDLSDESGHVANAGTIKALGGTNSKEFTLAQGGVYLLVCTNYSTQSGGVWANSAHLISASVNTTSSPEVLALGNPSNTSANITKRVGNIVKIETTSSADTIQYNFIRLM